MCNITHVKETKNNRCLLKNNNYLLKNDILNTKCTSSNVKYTILNFLTCVNLHMIEKSFSYLCIIPIFSAGPSPKIQRPRCNLENFNLKSIGKKIQRHLK